MTNIYHWKTYQNNTIPLNMTKFRKIKQLNSIRPSCYNQRNRKIISVKLFSIIKTKLKSMLKNSFSKKVLSK
jgi:hypothetical protein